MLRTMMALTSALLLAGGTLAAPAAGAQSMSAVSQPMHPMMGMGKMGKVVTVDIDEENGSKQEGIAKLVQVGKNVHVMVMTEGEPDGVAEPIHIHPGTCAKLDPKPAYALSNLQNGMSMTILKNVSLSSLTGGKYAINIHDAKNLAKYVACGDIK